MKCCCVHTQPNMPTLVLLETFSWPRAGGGAGSTECSQSAEDQRRQSLPEEHRRRRSKRNACSKRNVCSKRNACSKQNAFPKRNAYSERNACYKENPCSKQNACSKENACSKRNACCKLNACSKRSVFSKRSACYKWNAWWGLGAGVVFWGPLSLLVASLLPFSGTCCAEGLVVSVGVVVIFLALTRRHYLIRANATGPPMTFKWKNTAGRHFEESHTSQPRHVHGFCVLPIPRTASGELQYTPVAIAVMSRLDLETVGTNRHLFLCMTRAA